MEQILLGLEGVPCLLGDLVILGETLEECMKKTKDVLIKVNVRINTDLVLEYVSIILKCRVFEILQRKADWGSQDTTISSQEQ